MLIRPITVILFVLLAAFSLLLTTSSVYAISFTVNTLDDELNNDGDCSLREAITAANTNAAVDACPAGEAGVDTISFGVEGTLTLDEMLPPLTGALVLSGPGTNNLTLSGNKTSHVLSVTVGTSLEVSGLTLADAYGSGIVNSGTLSVTNSMFRDNAGGNVENYNDRAAGGAIRNYGDVKIVDSLFTNNYGFKSGEVDWGGAIYNKGGLTIAGSTFSKNGAGAGGAIYSTGDMTIVSSEFLDGGGGDGYNQYGGAIANGGTLSMTDVVFQNNGAIIGRAITNAGRIMADRDSFIENGGEIGVGAISNGGSVTIRNSSFARNGSSEEFGAIANGGSFVIENSTFEANHGWKVGAIWNRGAMTITNSTMARNDGFDHGAIVNYSQLTLINNTIALNSAVYGIAGVANYGQVTMANTLIAENMSWADGNAEESINCAGEFISLGHNLDGDGTCKLTGPGDITSSKAMISAALANNGGPTRTIALLPGSPAIDAGDNTSCAATPINNLDQRDFSRPIDGDSNGTAVCDIGAFEWHQTTGAGTITIVLDLQTNSEMDVEFHGDLGIFRLDDSTSNDGDGILQQRTFERPTGVYAVRQRVHPNFVFHGIKCDDNAVTELDLRNVLVSITVQPNTHTTCTFTNLRRTIIRAVVYKDKQRNGKLDGNDTPLNQWRVDYYDAKGNYVAGDVNGPFTNNLTNQQGKDGIINMPPGKYTVCLEMKWEWFNTQPANIHPDFGRPCYEVTVAPGKIAEVYFGNTDYPLAGATQVGESGGVVMRDVLNTEEMLDDEEWLEAPLQAPGLYMPLITGE